MKRFYVVPKSVLHEQVEGRDIRHHDLFISAGGAHWIELDETHVLLCCDDFDNAHDEKAWHDHPEVARLHHPVHAAEYKVGDLLHPKHGHKKFKHKHLAALKSIGVTEEHTVHEVSAIASKIHPLVKLDEPY